MAEIPICGADCQWGNPTCCPVSPLFRISQPYALLMSVFYPDFIIFRFLNNFFTNQFILMSTVTPVLVPLVPFLSVLIMSMIIMSFFVKNHWTKSGQLDPLLCWCTSRSTCPRVKTWSGQDTQIWDCSGSIQLQGDKVVNQEHIWSCFWPFSCPVGFAVNPC